MKEKVTPEQGDELRAIHPIQVVARLSGLSADVIRAWERRYGAIAPQRSTTRRRFYSDHDIERLTLLRRATAAGRRIGDIARLSVAELNDLITLDEPVTESVPGESGVPYSNAPDQGDTVAGQHLATCISAVQNLDGVALDNALAEAALALSIPVLLENVIHALMEHIGGQWRAGTLRACHEHMASAQVRSFLGQLLSSTSMSNTGPCLLVTTPRGQRHELGAMMVAVIAAVGGWVPLYLGPDMPSDEIAFAAVRRAVNVVALSVSHPADDPHLPEVLRRLRRQLPKDAALLVGGAAIGGYLTVLEEIGALQLTNLTALRVELDRRREAPL